MTYLVEGAYVFICLLDDWQQTIETMPRCLYKGHIAARLSVHSRHPFTPLFVLILRVTRMSAIKIDTAAAVMMLIGSGR